MQPVWIKICANTNLGDAKMAAELGADAVGFVFAPSPRQVNADDVAVIVQKLPKNVEKIGVFSTNSAEDIIAIVRKTRLTGIQLHGGFNVPLARRLTAEFEGAVAIIQTLHWELDEAPGRAEEMATQLWIAAREPAIDRTLIDSKTKEASGGTGLSFDWSEASQRLNVEGAMQNKLIVAGGLEPHNVAEAVKKLKPWGVDVASGVEISPGRKDAQKLERFVSAVRGVLRESGRARPKGVADKPRPTQ